MCMLRSSEASWFSVGFGSCMMSTNLLFVTCNHSKQLDRPDHICKRPCSGEGYAVVKCSWAQSAKSPPSGYGSTSLDNTK